MANVPWNAELAAEGELLLIHNHAHPHHHADTPGITPGSSYQGAKRRSAAEAAADADK